MANIKSSKKRIKVNEKKAVANKMIKSALKTQIKKFELGILNGTKEEATANLTSVVKALDMAASKNIIHKNKASRKKSRLVARLHAMA